MNHPSRFWMTMVFFATSAAMGQELAVDMRKTDRGWQVVISNPGERALTLHAMEVSRTRVEHLSLTLQAKYQGLSEAKIVAPYLIIEAAWRGKERQLFVLPPEAGVKSPGEIQTMRKEKVLLPGAEYVCPTVLKECPQELVLHYLPVKMDSKLKNARWRKSGDN